MSNSSLLAMALGLKGCYFELVEILTRRRLIKVELFFFGEGPWP